MNELDINKIKNRNKQILESGVEIIKDFPTNDNFSKTKYRKSWITTLFVDIVGYTKICETKKEKQVGLIIRTFHEGILSIMNHYKLKHIQIQGDGIFGVLPAKNKNDVNDFKIFDCALHINGFLEYFWKLTNYKISISSKEELVIVVGNENNREVVFAGGSVNEAKKIMDESDINNVILLSNLFVDNNEKVLNTNGNKYIFGKTNVEYFILIGIKHVENNIYFIN